MKMKTTETTPHSTAVNPAFIKSKLQSINNKTGIFYMYMQETPS